MATRPFWARVLHYRDGLDNYSNVIVAQTAVFNNLQTRVDLQTQRMTTAVQLIAALGGCWSTQ